MPAKKQVERTDILEAAMRLLREGGFAAIRMRTLAECLGCSTQPIYSAFPDGTNELQRALEERIYAEYSHFSANALRENRYPPYKAYGMAYIQFAKAEPVLFREMFMRDRSGERMGLEVDAVTQQAVAVMRENTGFSEAKALRLHTALWIFVHGIAAMEATGFQRWEETEIAKLISDAYWGIRNRMETEEGEAL